METRRSDSGFSPTHAEKRAAPLSVSATISVLALVCVIAWTIFSHAGVSFVRAQAPKAEASAAADGALALPAADDTAAQMATSDVAMIGPAVLGELVSQYQSLQQNGEYTPEAAAAVAEQLGQSVQAPVPYKVYSASDIHTSSDNSYGAMIAYRSALKTALEPIASLQDYELGVFAKYSETKDPSYLAELRTMISDLDTSAAAAAALTVPSDAAQLHINILNAMGQFRGTLEGLADNANDPITVMTLLKTYDSAESNMVSSFNSLAMYFAHHPQT